MSLTRVMESRPLDSMYDATYAGPYNPSLDPRVAASMSSKTIITGSSRYKYFKRSIMPRISQVPPQILLAPTVTQDPLVPVEVEPEPAVKNAEVQTMYRESEAQTHPYTPEYIIADGAEPEVLLLKDWSYETGVPLGKKEIEMIEHARVKKSTENNLPPFTDEASLYLRKKLMEQQELREFKLRESEIDTKREERMLKLQRTLIERDDANEFLSSQRVEVIRQTRMEEREALLQKIRRKRIKVLRRLAHNRNLADPSPNDLGGKNDIINSYFDKASQLYAPVKREGKGHKVGDTSAFDVSSRTAPLDNIMNIFNLENAVSSVLVNNGEVRSFSPVRAVELMSKTAPAAVLRVGLTGGGRAAEDRLTSAARREIRNTKRDLEEMNQILIRRKREAFNSRVEQRRLDLSNASAANALISTSPGGGAQSPSSDVEPVGFESPSRGATAGSKSGLLSKKPKGRPPTPDLTGGDSTSRGGGGREDQSFREAVVLLQRLIRGRAVQNVMYEGRYRRKELINELRMADEVMSVSSQSKTEVQLEIERKAERKANIQQSTIDAVAGGAASNILHVLSQEQDRMEALKQLQVIAAAALEERRRLEAAEAGRRQRDNVVKPPQQFSSSPTEMASVADGDELAAAANELDISDSRQSRPQSGESVASQQPHNINITINM